jgi:hypothetical protein
LNLAAGRRYREDLRPVADNIVGEQGDWLLLISEIANDRIDGIGIFVARGSGKSDPWIEMRE